MIPDLLWRCPLCGANDALRHRERWLLPDGVWCTGCQARWRLRRRPGQGFFLKLERDEAGAQAGLELPLAAWYDRMKAGIPFETLETGGLELQPGERLYLASRPLELWLEGGQPFPPPPQPPRRPGAPGAETTGTRLGNGLLLLTDRRLCWRGEAAPDHDFPLAELSGAFTILNQGLALTSGGWLFFFRLLHESPLKWVTYLDRLANAGELGRRRRMPVSHY